MVSNRIRGAVYIPARAYNAWQSWRFYDPDIAVRDLGYARSLGLNAIRLWCSYEMWLEDRDSLGKAMDHLFGEALRRGIRILVSAFEGCGIEPTRASLPDTDPWTGMCVASPGEAVICDPGSWGKPLAYLSWLAGKFGDHPALLALEPMNEPHHTVEHTRFVRKLFRFLRESGVKCPISHGALGGILFNLVCMDYGIDALQLHSNFPKSIAIFEEELRQADLLSRGMEKAVWISEWQRVRAGDPGWGGDTPLAEGEWAPDLASLAPSVYRYPRLGSFFWSLMLKPAYLPGQRKKGTLNGIFHEDGSVFSLADAIAVSENPDFRAPERRQWPEWASIIPRKAGLKGF